MTSNEWDEFAAEWDGNTATSAYADHAFAELAQVVDLAGLRVFDFGCGTGLLAERLSPHVSKVVALDGSSKMIEQLKLKALPNVFPIAGFLTASLMRRNTLLQTKFDLVTASSVCAFLPDYGAILQTLRSLLRSGGTYVQWDWLASEPDPWWSTICLRGRHRRWPRHRSGSQPVRRCRHHVCCDPKPGCAARSSCP